MATAEELLRNSAVQPDPEGHIVVGGDRKITVPANLKRLGVQYDHNMETVVFDCPRYWDKRDMSQMAIYVNYMRSDGYMDRYPVDNVRVDGDVMHFEWTISRNVTEVPGVVSFLVCVMKTDGSGNEERHWNSELSQEAYISPGMETEEHPALEYPDEVTQLLLRMSTVEQINVQANEMQQLYDATVEVANTAAEVKNEALDASNYIKNSYSNAIKSSVSGEIIRVDDVSPIEHQVKCKVRGKNLVNVDYIDGESSSDRSIIQKDGDTIVFPAFNGNLYGFYMNNSDLGMQVGKTYTASIKNISAFDVSSYGWRIRYTDGSTSVLSRAAAATFTVEKEVEKIIFRIGSPYTGNVESVISGIQIEEGSAVTEYEPHVDPSNINVTRYGKNLFPLSTFTTTPNSTTVNVTNGVLTLTGYLASRRIPAAGLVGKKLTISCLSTRSGERGGGLSIEFYDAANNRLSGIYKQNELSPNFSFTVRENTDQLTVFFYASGNAGDVGTATYRNIQLEFSDVSTPYESYVESISEIPSSDGTCKVMSISPTMTLFTDTPGAIVEAEYNVDTTKFLEANIVTERIQAATDAWLTAHYTEAEEVKF